MMPPHGGRRTLLYRCGHSCWPARHRGGWRANFEPSQFPSSAGVFCCGFKFVCKLGRSMGTNTDQPLWIRLLVVGIVVAIAAAGLSGSLRWVRTREKIAKKLMAGDRDEPHLPDVKVGGANNVVSVGQAGGVTAGTYVNQAVQPELRLLEQRDVVNSDGSHTTTFVVEVVAQVTPGVVVFDITADGILNVSIMPPPKGGVASINRSNVLRSHSHYHAELSAPRGRYIVSVQTGGQTAVKLNYEF